MADVHLGYRQYKLLDREKDFYRAFSEACKLAVSKAVDFVFIAGDLFNSRAISPRTLVNAIGALQQLQVAKIPVYAIEGNHDLRDDSEHNSLPGSWYSVLARSGLIHFLMPKFLEGSQVQLLPPKKASTPFSGYIDLKIQSKKIRLIGSRWHGSQSRFYLEKYKEGIEALETEQGKADFTIFGFHGGHENFLPLNRGGLGHSDLLALREIVDYVAMGHIHEHYVIEDALEKSFVFNPGSTEANNIAEGFVARGVLDVSVSAEGEIDHQLCTGFYNRKYLDFKLYLRNFSNQEDLIAAAAGLLRKQDAGQDKPMIRLSFQGQESYAVSREKLFALEGLALELGFLKCIIDWSIKEHTAQSWKNSDHRDRLELEKEIASQVVGDHLGVSLEQKEAWSESLLNIKAMEQAGTGTEEDIRHLLQALS